MKYLWEYSKQNEVNSLLISANMISTKSYQDSFKYILPYLPKNLAYYSIYFPDINYFKIENFWEYSNSYKVTKRTNKEISQKLLSILEGENLIKISNKDIDRMKNSWNEKSEIIEDFVYKIFRRTIFPEKVIFYPTSFGATTISNFIDSSIYLYIRIDADVVDIVTELLYSIIKNVQKQSRNNIIDKEIAEFFIRNTRLCEVFPDRTDILSESTSVKSNSDSDNYLKKLGFYSRNTFEITSDGISHKESGIKISNLTNNERALFTLLLRNSGKVVTFEEIGDDLYKNNFDEKFSLYYISRLISDIRRKLRLNGIMDNVISTKRGSGYMIS